jgi:hypothetical protein
LTWTAATDDTPPITYNIYYATADNGQNFGAAPQATTSNSTGYLVTGLTNTVEYWFVVRAEDSLGNETTHTADLNATPTAYTGGGDTTPPTFNGLTSATGAASAVNLVWSAASEASTGNSTPIIYNIYWSYTSGGQNFANGPQATTSNSTGETITGLINGQIYYFVVRAQDWAGNETPVGEDVEKSATPTGGTAPFFVDATTNIGCENRNPSLHQGSWSNAASDITCVINRNNGATKPYTVVVRYHASNVYSFDLEPGITLKAEDYLNLGRPKISGPINFADGLGSTQTVFDGFEVTGSPASRTQGTGACGSGGTDFDNDFIIRNNIFQGSDKPGIKHDGGCPTILNNEIRNVGRTGIRIYSPAGLSNQAMIIKGNYIHNNGSSGSATNSGKAYANVNFQTSGDNRYVIIQDNLIENAVMAGGIGIEPTDDNIYITGNEITTNARGGIRIGTNIAISGSYTGQITISGEPNFTFGGKSYSDGAPNKIHTNAFGGITTGVPMPNGIGIIRNEIYNNTWGGIHTGWWEPTYGFYTWPGTYGDVVVTIRKNKVYGNGTDTANAGGGIDVRHASGTIENNLVYDNKYAGIRVGLGVTYGTGMTIRHNTVVDNGRGGIVYHDDANNCYSCSTGAIPYPPKTIVRDNIITDNGYAALRGINFPNTDGVWERDYNILYNNNNFGSPETGPGDCSTATKVAICKIKQYGGFWGFNMDPNDIMADPFYKDYANNDFRLLEISPGYQSASDSGDRGAWGGSYPIDW